MAKATVEFINLKKARLGHPAACARLAQVHLKKGRRVLIRASSEAQAQELDLGMWTFDPASFVPHALAGGEDQAQEPALITHNTDNPNRSQVLILVEPPEEMPLTEFSHIILLIPQEEGPALQACRALYKAMAQQEDVDLVHSTRV